jgi:hypothetical protein
MTRRIISLIVICGAIGTAAILPPGQAAAADGTSPVAGKPPAPAGLRVGFMAYYTPETELVINAAGIENHRRVEAACASLHPLSFTQGGAAAVPERSRVALEKGDVDALLICTWASYPPRWYARVGETSSLSELAALGAKNNPEFRILWHAFMMLNHDKPADKDSKPALNLKSTRESLIAGRKQLEAEVDGVNERLGRRVACIVPVADAGLALMDKVVAGEVPGVTSVEELFAEPGGWGPGRQLTALAAYCHYATLYRASPEGLVVPFPEFKTKPKGAPAEINLGALTPAEDKILQKIAWETVSKYPYAGVAAGK